MFNGFFASSRLIVEMIIFTIYALNRCGRVIIQNMTELTWFIRKIYTSMNELSIWAEIQQKKKRNSRRLNVVIFYNATYKLNINHVIYMSFLYDSDIFKYLLFFACGIYCLFVFDMSTLYWHLFIYSLWMF